MYYKVEGGVLIPCPVNGIWNGAATGPYEKGASIFNYNLLPGPMLEAEGWKSSIVEDPQPAYEVETQELISWYEDCGTYIARRWKVTPRQPSEADKDEALTILGVAL